jgi:hypothetical protein
VNPYKAVPNGLGGFLVLSDSYQGALRDDPFWAVVTRVAPDFQVLGVERR